MADRPILFSGPMIRALLAGTKTQTRRELKPQPDERTTHVSVCRDQWMGIGPSDAGGTSQWDSWTKLRFAAGDRLWVRETHGFNHYEYERGKAPKTRPADLDDQHISYRADEDDCETLNELLYRPSIFMPRWASRLTLTVTDVRIARLQDCSEADAVAEGVEPENVGGLTGWRSYEVIQTGPHKGKAHPHSVVPNASPVTSYAELWNAINGPGAWEANPWIVAVSFEISRHNIDAEVPHV